MSEKWECEIFLFTEIITLTYPCKYIQKYNPSILKSVHFELIKCNDRIEYNIMIEYNDL